MGDRQRCGCARARGGPAAIARRRLVEAGRGTGKTVISARRVGKMVGGLLISHDKKLLRSRMHDAVLSAREGGFRLFETLRVEQIDKSIWEAPMRCATRDEPVLSSAWRGARKTVPDLR